MAFPSRIFSKLSNFAKFSVPQKQVLAGMLRRKPLRLLQVADSTANATTTLGASTYLTTKLEAGRAYKVSIVAQVTNGTAANGVKLGINLSGTQTTAVITGQSRAWDVTNTALVTNHIALSSGAYTHVDASSGDTRYEFNFVVQPQNDCVFDVRFAENASGGGTAVLKKFSYMEVEELEF